MIIYNVTVNIDNSVHDEWLDWMKRVHIPEVMLTGMFMENRIYKVLTDEDAEGTTYSIQYVCNSMKEYEQYRDIFAPALQAQHSNRYKDKFVAFRTLLEVIKPN
jgi:tricorn protease-like protein